MRYLALNLGPEGTRVNAISAGPIRTLAAAGVANFRKMLGQFEAAAPLRRTVTIEDVGNVAAFLCSDLAAGVTGEVTYVDAGYNIMGMSGIECEPPQAGSTPRCRMRHSSKKPGNAGLFCWSCDDARSQPVFSHLDLHVLAQVFTSASASLLPAICPSCCCSCSALVGGGFLRIARRPPC